MTLGVVHATRQGAAHLKEGTSNQDSVVVGMPSLGRLGSAAIMAVSDGRVQPDIPDTVPRLPASLAWPFSSASSIGTPP